MIKRRWIATVVVLGCLSAPLQADWMWRGTGALVESAAVGAEEEPLAAAAAPGEPLPFPTPEPDWRTLKADSDPGPLPVALMERAARYEPLSRAVESFQAGRFGQASRTCKRYLAGGVVAADGPYAQFLWAASEFHRGELNRSYDLFEDLERKFPATELGPHVARWELAIASRFLAGHKEKLLGLRIRDMRLDAQVILERLVERSPYGQLTDRLLARLGDCHRATGSYAEAILYYDRMLRDFPRSPVARQAAFSRLECLLLDCSGPGHDVGGLREAEQGLRGFIATYPRGPRAERARQYHRTVAEMQAEHAYRIAEFYVVQRRWEAARHYFSLVQERFTNTVWAGRADRRLKQLTPPSLTITGREPLP